MLNLASNPPDFRGLPYLRPHSWAVWSAAATPIVLIAFWIGAGYWQPPGYNPLQQTISVLAGYGAAHRWLMTLGLYLVATGYLITAAGLRSVYQGARMLLFVASLAGYGVALNPQPPTGSIFDHMAFAVTGAALLMIWPFAMALTRPPVPLFRPHGEVGAWDRVLGRQGCIAAGVIVAITVFAMLICAQLGGYLGLAERICTAVQTVPPLLFAVGMRRMAPPVHKTPPTLHHDPLHDRQ